MRVCFFNVTSTIKYGGLETYCWEIGRRLAQMGCTVDLLGGRADGGPPLPEAPGVNVFTFDFTPRQKVPIGGSRGRKLWERVTFARHAAAFFLERTYDVVLIVKPFDFLAMRWFKRHRSFKVVYSAGGRDFFAWDRRLSRAVDRFISTSAFNAQQVGEHYGVPVDVLPDGVDVQQFSPGVRDERLAASLGLVADRPTLITVGRIVGWKGLQVLMRALPLVQERLGPVQWLVAGDGEYLATLERLGREVGAAELVRYLGRIDHERLPEYFRLADCMVQPSVGDEAFGITMVEAMSCGLPVVASRIGGIPEVVADGETGLLVPPGDPSALSDALVQIFSQKDLRSRFAAASRERVLAHFDWDTNARRLLEIFQALLEPIPCASPT